MRMLLCFAMFSAVLFGQKSDRAPAKPAATPTAKPTTSLTAERSKLSALLPTPPGFSGRAEAPAKFYSSADLYRYIDGGADAYVDYGLVELIHREFKAGTVDLTVDIYDMGDPLRAFGVYSAERSPQYLFIPMGTEGYADVGSLNFLQGNYYVKLQAFGDTDKTPPVLESAAKSIVSKIGAAGPVPQPVAWFPAAGQVVNSIKYIVKAPLGHEYLAPATTVLYRFDGKETTVLASRAPSAGEAASRAAKLKEHFAGSGKTAAVAGLPGEVWRASNQYEGEMVFFARGLYVVIVQAPPADADAFLKELYSSVKD